MSTAGREAGRFRSGQRGFMVRTDPVADRLRLAAMTQVLRPGSDHGPATTEECGLATRGTCPLTLAADFLRGFPGQSFLQLEVLADGLDQREDRLAMLREQILVGLITSRRQPYDHRRVP